MGTKKPASRTAVVAAGRQCLRPPLPQRQGLIERYPRMSCESILAAATAPTVTRCLSHAHNAASARKLARKERIRPNRVCRLLQDLELAASAYSAHFTKLKGSDVALGTTTRFGTPSLVLAPGAANWT